MSHSAHECDASVPENESAARFSSSGTWVPHSATVSVSPASANSPPHAVVLGVEAKRRRVMRREEYLEREDEVPEGDLQEFECRMRSNNIEKNSSAWKMLWEEHAELRLQHNNPEGYREYLRMKMGVPADEPDEAQEAQEDFPDNAEEAGEHDEDQFMDMEDGEEEARAMNMAKPISVPSAETVRQHNLSHCTYRPWCPICVAGAANDNRHMPRSGESTCPEVAADYEFVRDRRGDKTYKPMLVAKYRGLGPYSAHIVPKKGIGQGWIVQQLLRDLRKWGLRGKLLLRSDGEPAILDLLSRVADLRKSETLMESSAPTDSRSNGLAERAIQSVEKQIRVLKIALERNLGKNISVSHPCFPWLVEHSADVLTKFQVGRDGMTAWERL